MKILTFLALFFQFNLIGQILKDPIAKNWIVEGLDKTYNFEFIEAEEIYNKIKAKYPNNPAYSTLMHMMLYTQYAPIKDFPKAKSQYLFYLNKSVELSEKLIEVNENDPEAIFFMLSSLGSLAAWQADNNEMLKAVNTARKAFPYMKKGMKLTEVQSDFLYTTGLYNYYIVQYPEDHPIVKPFMIFFSDGNKKLGLHQLDLSSKKSLFTNTESAYYSAYIYLKHEARADKAMVFINNLVLKYPNNLLFKIRQAECLIDLNKIELAQPIVNELITKTGSIYPVTGNIFQGIIEEKFKKNDKEAAILYKKALKIKPDLRYTQDYHAMANLGLGRIALRENNKKMAKEYLKKVLEMSEYKMTTIEAERLLKGL